MKEDQSKLKLSILFIEMLQPLKTKLLNKNFLLLVLRLSIFWLLMLEVVKSDFSEVPESAKPYLSWNLLIILLLLMVVILYLLVSEKEPEKVMICMMKWNPLESLILTENQELLLYTGKWMNLQVLEQESGWPVWLLPSISEMKKTEMCCYSLIIFSDSLKLVLKCQLYWEEFHLLSVINQP